MVRPRPPLAAVQGSVIIAHRGGSLEAPENTLAAVKHGMAVGADWVEVDVTLSADNQVVVIHDDTVDRTTDGSGLVADKTVAELRTLSTGRPRWLPERAAKLTAAGIALPDFGDQFASERIPTLDEVLQLPDAMIMIEMKRAERDKVKPLAKQVIAAVHRASAERRVILASFAPELLWAAYDLDPTLPLLGLAKRLDQLQQMLALPVAAVGVHTDIAQPTLERAPPGLAVWVWTIYDVATAEQLTLQGVHGLITDLPEAVVAALRPPIDMYINAKSNDR